MRSGKKNLAVQTFDYKLMLCYVITIYADIMKTIKPITIVLLSSLMSLTTFQTLASETLDSHEHGSASLDIAIDDNVIAIRFESPAANIVGFEYAPNDEEQRSLITDAKSKLSSFDTAFKLRGKPECKVLRSFSNWVSDHDEHSDHSDHSDHDEHKDETLKAEHAEFLAEFDLQCEQADRLTAIDVQLMALFPAINKVDVQVIDSLGQTKQTLTIDNSIIKLNNE